MIYLDTHIVVWLYDKREELFTQRAIDLIEANSLFISPVVKLELQYLYEIKRVKNSPTEILDELENTIDLKIRDLSFEKVIDLSLREQWTRDPFDRIITAYAKRDNKILLTKDKKILSNYHKAIWQ